MGNEAYLVYVAVTHDEAQRTQMDVFGPPAKRKHADPYLPTHAGHRRGD